MEKTNYSNSVDKFNLESTEDEIDLRDLWNGILRNKKWLFSSAILFLSGSIIFTLHARIYRPIYRGSFTLLISDPMGTEKIEKNLYDSNSTLFSDLTDQDRFYEINTLITFLKSPIYLEPIAKKFNLSPDYLKQNISIDQSSDEIRGISKGILNVYFNFRNKATGEKILKTLAEYYLNSSLEQKQKRLRDGLKFLNQQKPEIQKKKDILQSKLVTFREKNKLIEPEIEGTLIKDRQENIEKNIISLTKERNRLIDVRNEIKKGTLTARGLKQELGAGLSISDFDQGLLQELINVENELAKAKSKYTSNSSVVQGLQNRLEKIQPLLLINQLEAVDTALKLNSGSLNSFRELKKDIENQFLEQPILIKQYQNIAQELEMANDNLLSLVAARESFQLEMAQSSIPWKLISEPKMGSTLIRPNIQKNLFIGTIGGLFIGAIIALIRDRLNHIFRSPNEVKKDLNYPILGTLPHVEVFEELRQEKKSILTILNQNKSQDKEIDSYQRFFFQEAFRNLYTSIRFLDTTQDVKIIVLTSSLPKEGKTLTNILLAKTLADLGLKVLLIDADLRKPQVHYRLGLNNLKGFSNLIIDPETEVKEVINKIEMYDNWDVITGGTPPPDPTRLLGSERFKNIIKELKKSKKYEIILLDTPPLLGLADSLLISEEANGVIILIGLGAVDRSLPREAINKIKSVGLNFYGIVTNQTKKDGKSFDNKYGYGGYGGKYGKYQSYGYMNAYYPLSTYQNYNQLNNQDKVEPKSLNKSEANTKKIGIYSKLKSIKIFKTLSLLKKWLDN